MKLNTKSKLLNISFILTNKQKHEFYFYQFLPGLSNFALLIESQLFMNNK